MAQPGPGKEPSSSHLSQRLEVVGILPAIILFIVSSGCQAKKDGTRRKIVHPPPDHRRNVQAVIGAIEMNALLLLPVVNNDIKTTRHRDEKLVASLQSMTPAVRASWHVIE